MNRRRNITPARSYRRSPLVPLAVERWMPVVGWEDLYQVSDQYRVRSLDRVVVEHSGRQRRHRGRMLSASPAGRNRRPAVILSEAGRRKCCYVDVLVHEAFGITSTEGKRK